jgi:hypothetical protein
MASWDNVGFRFSNAGVHFSTLSGSMGPITFQPHSGNTAGAVRILPGNTGGKGLIIEGLSGQTANLLEIRTNGATSGDLVTVQANGNVGIGTTAPNSKLHVAGSISVAITRKTANYTLTDGDRIVACDASAGAFTVSLPSAVGIAGRMYTIKKVDSSPNPVTVAPQPGQTIDGAASYVLSAQWKYVTVVSDGSNWLVIANN